MSNEAPAAPAMMPLVQLPSGVAINPAKILFIARQELNAYVVFMENSPTGPKIDGRDLDTLIAYGVVQPLEAPKPAADAPAAASIEVAK